MKFVIEELQSLSFLLCFKKFQVLFYVEPIGIVLSFSIVFFLFHFQTSARGSSPYPPWSSGSGWTSRRSSWNSLGRAPSLKRQKHQSGERRSLLSGEGGSSSEEGEGGGDREGAGEGLIEDDNTSLARTDSMSHSQRVSRHRRMESLETRSSMDLPPDALLQVPNYCLLTAVLLQQLHPKANGHNY